MYSGDKRPRRPPRSLPTWGIVRGEAIHIACATENDLALTWAAFKAPGEARDGEKCARCPIPLTEAPDP